MPYRHSRPTIRVEPYIDEALRLSQDELRQRIPRGGRLAAHEAMEVAAAEQDELTAGRCPGQDILVDAAAHNLLMPRTVADDEGGGSAPDDYHLVADAGARGDDAEMAVVGDAQAVTEEGATELEHDPAGQLEGSRLVTRRRWLVRDDARQPFRLAPRERHRRAVRAELVVQHVLEDAWRLAGDVLEDERVLRTDVKNVLASEIVERVHNTSGGKSATRPAERQRQIERLFFNNALLARPEVVFTPHIAFNTTETIEAMAGGAAKNIEDFLEGRELA